MGEQRVSNLERRYRRLLKALPPWYRQDREEEMVGIFLANRTDEFDLEHGRPGWGETGAVLGLATRTRLAAGAALADVPAAVVRRGEVVRAIGVIGLLMGVFFAGSAITDVVRLDSFAWTRLFAVLPILAFVALLAEKRTLAKVLAALAVLPAFVALVDPVRMWVWALWQLPGLVTLLALCLGFHRDAPTPPARGLAWWGGGALVLGVLSGFASGLGLVVIVLTVVVVRVFAYVRGDVVLGRALTVMAVLEVAPIAFPLIRGEIRGIALGLMVLVVVSAVAPVRKRRVA